MRCLALGEEWFNQGGSVTIISNCNSELQKRRIADKGFQLISIIKCYPDSVDLEITLKTIDQLHSSQSWVVLDGYNFDADYQIGIKNNCNRLLIIDDVAHQEFYFADIILNQNISGTNVHYNCHDETKLLLGTDYVLLRDEFLKYKQRNKKIHPVANNILVTIGGSDPENVTLRVMNVLDKLKIENLKIKVIIGSNNPNSNSLKKESKKLKHNIDLLYSPQDIPELMAWADVAVSSGGSTVWELAFMGLPSLVFCLATNQEKSINKLGQYGSVVDLGWHNKITDLYLRSAIMDICYDQYKRKKMSHLGKTLIDGEGTDRVLSIMKAMI